MIDYGQGITGFIITLISFIHGCIACVISFTVFAIIICYQYNNRLRRQEKRIFLLSANIYFLIFIYITTIVSFNIQTIIGDVYGINFDSSSCIFRGYFIPSICSAMYHAFVTQAFFRLCRIVYSNYRWLQVFWFYIIAIPIQVVGGLALLSPVLIWNDVVYLSNEYSCFTSFKRTRGILWVVFTGYGLPLIYLTLIYIRIIVFLRHQSNTLSAAIKRKQERDLVAIRRIFINVGLLFAIGLPGMVLLIMLFITGIEHPLTYRIVWIGAEVSMAVLSIEMVLATPQLRNVVLRRRRRQQNRVAAFDASIQMETMTTT